jgi:hypothetical protein
MTRLQYARMRRSKARRRAASPEPAEWDWVQTKKACESLMEGYDQLTPRMRMILQATNAPRIAAYIDRYANVYTFADAEIAFSRWLEERLHRA